MSDSAFDRRTLLTGGALAVGGAALLAGCGGGDAATAGASSSSSSSTSSETPSASTSATSSTSTTSKTKAPADAVVALSDVPVGGAVAAKVNGKPVFVAQPEKGKVVAHSAICTHQGCPVKAQGAKLVCPCHASAFDSATGKVLQGPANAPLAAVAVHVVDGAVVAGDA